MTDINEILRSIRTENWRARKRSIEYLLSCPEDLYISALEDWLRNGDDALLRNAAIETYTALGTRAFNSLKSMIKDKDSDVRIFTANIFGDIRDNTPVFVLIEALKDPDVNVRIAVAEALGKIKDERAVDALARAIEDEPWVSMSCIEALGEIGGKKAMPILLRCLEKEEYRGIALCAIEKAGDHHFIKHLTPYIYRDDGLGEMVLRAIVSITEREGIKPPPSFFTSLVPLLIELQKSSQPDIRRAAFIALTWAEDLRGIQYFINALASEDLQEYAVKGIVSIGKKAIPVIMDSLKKSGANRAILAKILRMLGENSALLMSGKPGFMSEDEFNLLRELINREFGLSLKGDKRLILHAKISHRLKILELSSYRDYYDFIISDPTKDELYTLASHIMNNETYFFREKTQLDVFLEILKEVKKEKLKNNRRELKIASLACSSGEEAYTLNMVIQESGLFVWDWDIKILGIDIDKNAIKKARLGCYNKNSFRSNGAGEGRSHDYINKYFISDGDSFTLRKSITHNVEFSFGNVLNKNTLAELKDADIIFCRNVLIYMDDNSIARLAENIYECLSDSGCLFIGSTESLIQKTELFLPEYTNGIIVYRKNQDTGCAIRYPQATRRGDDIR